MKETLAHGLRRLHALILPPHVPHARRGARAHLREKMMRLNTVVPDRGTKQMFRFARAALGVLASFPPAAAQVQPFPYTASWVTRRSTARRPGRQPAILSVYCEGGLYVPEVSRVRAGLDRQLGESRCHLQQGRAQILLACALRRTEEFVRLLDIDRDMIGFHAAAVSPRCLTSG